jgi:TatD DNase family protein
MQTDEVEQNLQFIEENIDRIVGIGEIGLDYHKKVRAAAPKDGQKGVLKEILGIACKYEKPAIIHSRYAWKDAYELVKESCIEKAVFHWYTGFSSVLREIIEAGYFISVTPAAEYHEEHRRAVKEAPLERLLLETDTPVQYGREERFGAEPADVIRSLTAAAALKGLEEEVLAAATTRNAIALFCLPL